MVLYLVHPQAGREDLLLLMMVGRAPFLKPNDGECGDVENALTGGGGPTDNTLILLINLPPNSSFSKARTLQ